MSYIFKYVMRKEATERKLIDGLNCSPLSACDEFEYVKHQYHNDSLSQVIIEYKNGETEKKKPAYLRNTKILLKDTFPLNENYINPMYLLNNCEDIFLKNRYVCNPTVNEIQRSKMSADYELKRLIRKLPHENHD